MLPDIETPTSSSGGDYTGLGRKKTDGVVVQRILGRNYVDNVPDEFVRIIAPSCSTEGVTQPQFSRVIDDFPNEPYKLVKPIPVMIRQNAPADFTANFHEANIAMPGETIEEAMANLTTHILDLYEVLRDQPTKKLARHPREQLATLRRFLVEA